MKEPEYRPFPGCVYELEEDYPTGHSGNPVYSIIRVDGLQRELIGVRYNLERAERQVDLLNDTGYPV